MCKFYWFLLLTYITIHVSQKHTISHVIQSPFNHNFQVLNTHQHFPHSEASLSSWNLRPQNHYGQTSSRTVVMLLCFPFGQSVHCCIRHTTDIPRHIPHPLWLKVIPNSISYFLQTHTQRFRSLPLPLLLTLQHQYRWRPTNFPIQIFGKRLGITHIYIYIYMCVCVCVCVCVEECKGRDFLLMVLQEGGKEEMQKEVEKL